MCKNGEQTSQTFGFAQHGEFFEALITVLDVLGLVGIAVEFRQLGLCNSYLVPK